VAKALSSTYTIDPDGERKRTHIFREDEKDRSAQISGVIYLKLAALEKLDGPKKVRLTVEVIE
jgi:hypothetical protein